jgi:hypothetical protein
MELFGNRVKAVKAASNNGYHERFVFILDNVANPT